MNLLWVLRSLFKSTIYLNIIRSNALCNAISNLSAALIVFEAPDFNNSDFSGSRAVSPSAGGIIIVLNFNNPDKACLSCNFSPYILLYTKFSKLVYPQEHFIEKNAAIR